MPKSMESRAAGDAGPNGSVLELRVVAPVPAPDREFPGGDGEAAVVLGDRGPPSRDSALRQRDCEDG
ncbi:hypothetical protein DL769_010410 [Monosporascus sp. CRB-8-3]|nr:hypothetical protein DL769_010410 [Monosporascus sp. CRB-8-3]